jgi:hypothetical protein
LVGAADDTSVGEAAAESKDVAQGEGEKVGTPDHTLAASVSALVMGDAVGIFFGDLGVISANESVGVMFGAFFGVGAGGVFIDTP